ncbi:glycosyltransferase family 4 protein [uncultured Sneathiella sp.]|jgi:glycosyltransferase involved in cell wall biosynthesis|uniref:glycosyltransferase family 4 protein n=1 Tax=uncultured Sneathiella sp. TaxID=879315 RepID=UPI0030D704E8|tara:strand:- start:11850 stop:13124 length:1275 start_codon:yes stop_codon:yes gene_type:complete
MPIPENESSTVIVVLKGYPRLSETFIAQELLALEQRGLNLSLVSLRHPTDKSTHPVHEEISAPVNYLPEYLYQEPLRVLKSWWKVRHRPGYREAWAVWRKDLRRDLTSNRIRRFGQALVLAAEMPEAAKTIYAHFLHTPASVARYASMIAGMGWSCSAHAKDIWTTPEWELREKLADLDWLVTCTSVNAKYLGELSADNSKVELMYHGLDLTRFPEYVSRSYDRDGTDLKAPVEILSVGRAVAKKGYDDLLTALAALPQELNWRFVHIGGGPLLGDLKAVATKLGIADRIDWRGALPQREVLAALQSADIFVLASRIADDGDRDGLPNVLMEAQSQKLPVVATNVSAIPELVIDGETGLLVPERNLAAMTAALMRLCAEPALREQFAEKGNKRLRELFDANDLIGKLYKKLHAPSDETRGGRKT